MNTPPTILVTGASRGLGRATAQCLARLGCRLALCSRTAPEPWWEELPKEMWLYETLDLGQTEQIGRFVAKVAEKFGSLDVLINNASLLGPSGPIAETDLDGWIQAINVNICGSVAMLKCCLPLLRTSRGCAIQVTSSAGFVPIAHCAPYCLTKAAQIMLLRTLGTEEQEVKALCYDPSMMDSDMQATVRSEVVPKLPQPYQQLFTQPYKQGLVFDLPSSGYTLAWVAIHHHAQPQGAIVNGADPQLRQLALDWWTGHTASS